jgi:glycosyltransferase involved in cell wall biosynthesis
MKIHLLALPNVQTTREFELDGFCTATIRFARLLERMGMEVILYGSEENEAPCSEFVTCVTRAEQTELLKGVPYQYAGFDNGSYPLWALANGRMIDEIAKRKAPRDMLLTIGGLSQKPVFDAHQDMMGLEYFVGYISTFAHNRVFASHYWRANTHGRNNEEMGRFFDAVIYGFFDETILPFEPKKQNYALYVGRITTKKGLEIACRSAQEAGIELICVGHGHDDLVTHGARYCGAVSDADKFKLMANAQCLIAPTTYIEPLGNTVIEAQLCGTPVVTTDFGGFAETVEYGKTGYRCNYLGEFVQAIEDCKKLDPRYIRDRAVENYSMATAQIAYAKYFKRLNLLWDEGFYSLKKELV